MPTTALPYQILKKKLSENSMTVSLFPYLAGSNLKADVVFPTASISEWEHDLTTPLGLAKNSYSMVPKLAEAPPGIVSPPELMILLAKAGGGIYTGEDIRTYVDISQR